MNTKIGLTDRVATEDLFNIKQYIDGLASFVLECATPLTISLQGAWGSGKTSMMYLVREKLLKDAVVIEFNTWQFSQFNAGGDLSLSMLTKLTRELTDDEEKLKNIQRLRQIALGATKSVAGMVAGYFGGEYAKEALRKTLSEEKDEVSDFAEALTKLKLDFESAIKEKLKNEKKDRVVFFIDDLDRLEPTRAVELLEIMKNFLDCKQCVFILAIDYDVVVRGVAQKYNFDKKEQESKGKQFFDKIIQLPFKMPVNRYEVGKYAKECLEAVGVRLNNEQCEVYIDLIRYSIGTNPRAMKRLFNSFGLLQKIAPKKDDTREQIILFALLCMQSSEILEVVYDFFITSSFEAKDFEDLQNGTEETMNTLFKNKTFKEEEIAQISDFICKLVEIIKGDEKEERLSEKDIELFKNVLSLSSVTSNGNVANNAKRLETYKVSSMEEFKEVDKIKYNVKEMSDFFASFCELSKGVEVNYVAHPKAFNLSEVRISFNSKRIATMWHLRKSSPSFTLTVIANNEEVFRKHELECSKRKNDYRCDVATWSLEMQKEKLYELIKDTIESYQ